MKNHLIWGKYLLILFTLTFLYHGFIGDDFSSKYPPSKYNPVVVAIGGRKLYVIDVDLWNIKWLKGEVEVKFNDDIITIYADIDDYVVVDKNTPVLGYPEVWIGCKPWGNPCANDWDIVFPTTDYDFDIWINTSLVKKNGVINIAFDLWFLSQDNIHVDPLSDKNTVELMFWIYYDPKFVEWMMGRGVIEVVIPLNIDGRKVYEKYYLYHSRGRYNFTALFPVNRNLSNHLLRFNLETLINIVEKYGVDIHGKYLAGIEIGSEIYGSRTEFILTIYSFGISKTSFEKKVDEKQFFKNITEEIKDLKEKIALLDERCSLIKVELNRINETLNQLKENYREIFREIEDIKITLYIALIFTFVSGLLLGYFISIWRNRFKR